MLRTLADEIEARPDANDIRCLKLFNEGSKVLLRQRARFIRTSIPTLILDATASEPLYHLVFEGIEYHRLDVERTGSGTQTHNRIFSMTDLRRGTGRLYEKLQRVIDDAATRHASGLIVTYKFVEDEQRLTLPEGWRIAHFGNIRGTLLVG